MFMSSRRQSEERNSDTFARMANKCACRRHKRPGRAFIGSPRWIYSTVLIGCVGVGTYTGYVSTPDVHANAYDTVDVPVLPGTGNAKTKGRNPRRHYGMRKRIRGSKKKKTLLRAIADSGRAKAIDKAKPPMFHKFGTKPFNISTTMYTFPTGMPFRPDEFFTIGAGRKYNNTKLDVMGIKNPSLNSITYMNWEAYYDGSSKPRVPTFPQHILYIHLRKAAGTSIENSMVSAAKMMMNATSDFYHSGVRAKALKLFPWRYRNSKERREEFEGKSARKLQSIQAHGQHAKVFTVIRDPVSRFISGVKQHLGMGSVLVKKRNPCVKSTPHDTVDCVLKKIEEKGPKLDVHYVPMAVNLKAVLRGRNISIDIYQMDDLPVILKRFGASPDYRERSGNESPGILSEITIDTLDVARIARICKHYEIDVDMMHHLGLKVPFCDGETDTPV